MIFIFVFEKCQNLFLWGLPFGLLWPEFWRWKLWDQNFVPSYSETYTLRKVKNQVFILSIELRTKFVWSHGLLGNGSLATYKLVSSTAVLLWLFKFLERFWLIYSRIIFDVTYILHDFNFSPLMLNLRSLMDLHLRSEKYLQALGKKVLATEYLRLHQIPCWVSNQVYLVWSQS